MALGSQLLTVLGSLLLMGPTLDVSRSLFTTWDESSLRTLLLFSSWGDMSSLQHQNVLNSQSLQVSKEAASHGTWTSLKELQLRGDNR
eukprot:767860-Hanusia_phi.AAC.6